MIRHKPPYLITELICLTCLSPLGPSKSSGSNDRSRKRISSPVIVERQFNQKAMEAKLEILGKKLQSSEPLTSVDSRKSEINY